VGEKGIRGLEEAEVLPIATWATYVQEKVPMYQVL
jgi:hypothetical protein